MGLTKTKIASALLLLTFPLALNAQTDTELRRHIIIAIDHYVSSFNSWRDNPQNFDTLLSNLFTPQLTSKDYVSVVNYGLGTDDTSFDSYTTNTIAWESYDKFKENLNRKDNSDWQNKIQHINKGKPFSLLTGAKFYAFHALYGRNDGKEANKVYLLDITDEHYNGNNDYKAEFTGYKDWGGRLDYDDFRNTILAVTRDYNFILDREVVLKEILMENGKTKYYKALLFEIVPHVPHLNSVVDYPANLGLKRVPGGFKIQFNYRSIDSMYQIKRFNAASVCGRDSIEIIDSYINSGGISRKIHKSEVDGDTLRVILRVWLEQKDKVYSGLVFSPFDEDCTNLTVSHNLLLPPRPKILGFIPLYDEIWWFFPQDADSMVAVWTGVLIFLLCLIVTLLVTFFLRKLFIAKSNYNPSDDVINLSHI